MSLVQEVIEEAGLSPRSYSGRGMYGKTCLSFNTKDGLLSSIAQVIEVATQHKSADEALADLCDALCNACMDNMGRDMVIYFPGIEFKDLDADESESEIELPADEP